MTKPLSSDLKRTDKNDTINLMTALSSQPYKGTRDYYPEQKRVQNYIFDTWKQVSRLYGYEEYGTPMLEPIEVYLAKSGEELATQQTYTFTDRGGRTVAIRPEMTPSVSRIVAGRRQELAYPARLFSIANFMRYERPQRGREREFWQLNADIFGAEGAQADAEIIAMGADYLKAFGADDSMFVIKINSRKVIDITMKEYLELDEVNSQQMVKLFDRKDKMPPHDFLSQAGALFTNDVAEAGLRKVVALLDAKSIADLPDAIRRTDELKEIQVLFDTLGAAGITNAVFDISLMRGLDYYTGMVFEVFDTHPDNNRSLFGGGRYDGLVGLFGAEPISAVGVAPGLTMTELFLQTHNLTPPLPSLTEVYVVVLGDTLEGATKLARDLRSQGITTELDISGRKVDKQLKTAGKKEIPYLVFVGEDELKTAVYPFKNAASSDEQKLNLERIVAAVKDQRRA